MYFLKKLFLHSYAKYIVLFCIGCALVLIYLLANGFDYGIYYADSTFIAGAAIVISGGLSMLNYFGAYDFWGYAFSIRKQRAMNRTLPEYAEIMKGDRQKKGYTFGPYFAVGAIFLIVSALISVLI